MAAAACHGGHGHRWPGSDGPHEGSRPGRARRVGPSGSAGTEWIRFVFFSKYFSVQKKNSGSAQKMFRGTKNTQKITKIPEKFPMVD
jgi:hypothetical protein